MKDAATILRELVALKQWHAMGHGTYYPPAERERAAWAAAFAWADQKDAPAAQPVIAGTKPARTLVLYSGSTKEPYIDIDGADLWCNAEDFTDEERGKIRWMVNAANAVLATPQAPAPAPDGFVLVPVEPTEEMLRAHTGGSFSKAGFSWARRQWAAMLTARPAAQEQSRATRDVLAERQRQINVEGWTPKHDDQHTGGGMAYAAAAYAVSSAGQKDRSFFITSLWAWTGWAKKWFEPQGARADLVRAGALILAEIERLDRAAAQEQKGSAS